MIISTEGDSRGTVLTLRFDEGPASLLAVGFTSILARNLSPALLDSPFFSFIIYDGQHLSQYGILTGFDLEFRCIVSDVGRIAGADR